MMNEEQLSPETIAVTTPQVTPEFLGDPIPFDIDKYVTESNSTKPIGNGPDNRLAFSRVIEGYSKAFAATGYNTAAAVNRGLGALSSHLGQVQKFIEISTGMEHGTLWEDAAKIYEEGEAFWKKHVEEVGGITFLDEILSEAVGGFVPGVAQFALDVASGLTFPYMDGAVSAYEKGESPFMGGIEHAAKTGILAGIFRMIGPLKQYLRAPIMGTVFGLQEAETAPEGQKFKGFVKGAAIGAGYSLSSPGGRMGLNDVERNAQEFYASLPEMLKGEAGGADIQKKPRKFLKTVAEAQETSPELAEKVKNIKPEDYIVQPNPESVVKARTRLSTEGIDKTIEYLKSDAEANAEKGATFIELSRHFEKQGDYGRASDMIEEYDKQLRGAGRFVQAASLWSHGSAPSFIRWSNKQLDSCKSKYGWADTLFKNKPEAFTLTKDEQKEIFKRFREIKEMPEGADRADATLQLIDMVAQKVPPSVSELVDSYRYQNMLSSPKTQGRNIENNMLSTWAQRPADIAMTAGIDYVKAGLFGKEREHYINDVPVYMKAAINAVPNATKAFMSSLKMVRGEGFGKPELGIESKTEFERARAKQIPTSLQVVQRFMEACDKFNIAVISAGEYAVNKKNGLSDVESYRKGQEIADTYLLRNKLESGDPQLSVFSKGLSGIGEMIDGLRKKPGIGPLAKLYVPFIKTPINLGVQMIEHSPVGFARKGFDTEELAKPMVGSIVSLVGLMLAASGKTTWSIPTDPQKKELFYATDRKAYSIDVGGGVQVPVWYLGFYAFALAIPMALKHYIVDEKKSMLKEGPEMLVDALLDLAKFMGQQTSTQSIGALFSVLDGDADHSFWNQSGYTVQQFIPGNAFVRWINTIIDPVYRKPDGFIENIEKDLPFLSKQLEARTKPIYGEESRRRLLNSFIPYDIGVKDPLYEEQYQAVSLSEREKYLVNKLNAVRSNKELSPEKRMKKAIEIYNNMPKAFD